MKKGVFVTIHGIDGTGKTETADSLVRTLVSRGIKAMNYDAYKSGDVSNPFEPIKKWVETHATVPAQFDFHLASMTYHSNTIQEWIAKGWAVVRSRYIEDVIAHYMYLKVPYVQERVRSANLLRQDMQVVLTLPEEIRRERIARRGEFDARDKEVKLPGSRLDFFERYLLYISHCMLNSGKVLVMDTSVLSIQEVTERVIECLLKRELIS